MRTRTIRSTVAALTVAGMLAVPAAATGADTTVSFTVAASGALAVSQAASTATLTDGGGALSFDALSDGTVSGTLPATTVTDDRGTPLGGWTVAVVATGDWENSADDSITVGAENARAYFDVASASALTTALGGALSGMAVTGGEFNVGTSDLATSYTLLSGTTTLGNGSVTFSPAIDITVPAGTPAGTYSAVVRQTVS